MQSHSSVPSLRSAEDLYVDSFERCRLSFGCPVFDEAFEGGLPLHGLSEVCGEAGSGKTQMCLQLAVSSVLPASCGGRGGKCCYLTTQGEGLFPVKRLEQLCARGASLAPSSEGLTKDGLMDRVLIRACGSVEALFDVIDNDLARLMADGQVACVIIDSVAGAFRGDEDYDSPKATPGSLSTNTSSTGIGNSVSARASSSSSSNSRISSNNYSSGNGQNGAIGQARARDLFLFAAHLRRLSFLHHAPVVVVNQATAHFGSGGDYHSGGSSEYAHVHSDARAAFPDINVKPALGLTWTTCVNRRLMLIRRPVLRHNGSGGPVPDGGMWRRDALLMLSPSAPFGSVQYSISADGIAAI
jgi:hypothetical protein